jgi:hypothetical protein
MREEFLHYVWLYKQYNQTNLKTHCGQSVEIIHPGVPNTNAGADFFNAKIKLNGTLWAGNIEVHKKASDWYGHQHHTDKKYDNVILHVVDSFDKETFSSSGESIPTLVLQYYSSVYERYDQFISNGHWLRCSDKLHLVNKFELKLWFQRLVVERLESKEDMVVRVLESTKYDWDEAFYRLLFRGFGFGINGDVFERLAKSTPLKIILKYTDQVELIESLLLGQAGFLERAFDDEYMVRMDKHYAFLKNKHHLIPLEDHLWRFLRIRPTNFPIIRISQLSHLLVKLKGCFGKMLNEEDLSKIEHFLSVGVSSYWELHYLPDKAAKKNKKKLGETSKKLLIINVLIPFLFAKARMFGSDKEEGRVFKWLSEILPEKNSIIDVWVENEIMPINAGDSQALIYLSNQYCKLKKCLQCRIGHQLLVINRKE